MRTCNNASRATHKSILVVDDEPTLREVLRFSLERAGHTVFTAEDGSKALQFIETNKIDLVLTDVRMPGGDCHSLLAKIETLAEPKPQIVLMSGALEIDAHLIDLNKPAAIVHKPFEWDELNNILNTLLNLIEPQFAAAASHS